MLIKHSMSVAGDLNLDYQICVEQKLVTVAVPFFDSYLVESFLLRRLVELGIDVVRDDNQGWFPPRPAWKVMIDIGAQHFSLEIIRLMFPLGSSEKRYALVLTPLP